MTSQANCIDTHGRIVMHTDDDAVTWRVCVECGSFVDWKPQP